MGLKRKAAFLTLGCKVNQYETDAMKELLADAGYEIVEFSDRADVYVINTCSVTNVADRKSRQMIHRARRKNPDAVVAAAGCYIQTGGRKMLDDGQADLLIGNNRKKDIVAILDKYYSDREIKEQEDRARAHEPQDWCFVHDIAGDKDYEPLALHKLTGHTRAYLKIQDGCNQFCSYCIIPYARGRIRSRDPQLVIEEVKRLTGQGFREVVLTGIHLSSYGLDLAQAGQKEKTECQGKTDMVRVDGAELTKNQVAGILEKAAEPLEKAAEPLEKAAEPLKETAEPTERVGRTREEGESRRDNPYLKGPVSLLTLIEDLQKIPDLDRIRLSSLEPRIITEEFVCRLRACDKVCPHFHLSLQSGCDATLRRMNRKYTTADYREAVNLLRTYYDRPAITTDVIAGFVGETEEEFQATRSFLEEINLYEMHVFKYSVREGTRAQKMEGHLPEEVKAARSAVLIKMASDHKRAYEESFIGSRVQVLLEEETVIDGRHYWQGFTDCYVKVFVENDEQQREFSRNTLVNVSIIGFLSQNKSQDGLFGKVSIEF